jgi:ribosomal protein S27E
MANTLAVACPKCKKAIKVAAELAGKKIRCKGCGQVFALPGSPAARPGPDSKSARAATPAASAAAPPAEDDDANPYGFSDTVDRFRCPNCANEMESDDAIICLNCGYNTMTRQTPGTRVILQTTGWEQTKWLLPGVGAIIGICIVIGALVYYHFELPYVVFDSSPSWAEAENDKETEGSRTKIIKKLDAFTANMFHPMIEVWLVVFAAFIAYYLGRFAFTRLILEPRPPERLKKGT